MSKELFSYLFVLLALFVGALYYNNTIQSPLIAALNNIKSNYHHTLTSIQESFNEHFFQAEHIKELQKKLQLYEESHLVMHELANEVDTLFDINHSPLKVDTNISLVRTISYEKFGNFNRIWLEVPEYNASKVYGLTYKEFVAGIVISKNNKALALLNQDIKSAYSVYVGEDSAPGIAHGNNDEHLAVNFIPAWFKIREGDEVISSGLDNLFIKGLKVGRVISVSSSQGYQNAIVEPYYKNYEPNYFHLIRSVR